MRAMARTTDTIHDELLVLAAQGGDAAAFEALLRRWLPVMLRHAARVTGDAAAAEDVAQEAGLALVGALGRLRDPAGAQAWALRIVTNKAVDWVRRRRRDRALTRTVQNREPRTPPSDCEGDRDSSERTALVRAACLRLPPDLRALVSLYYGEEMPVAAIAAGLGVPVGTVKSRLHEARAQLRTLLERNPA